MSAKSMINKYPPFSVLMSVYKNEKSAYLDMALTSIENQTVIPNEIILVEDGPLPSELKNVIIKHKKIFGKKFKDIVLKKNHGLGGALRLGTKYVSTEWIARMDSDDVSVPERFEKQLKLIVSHPSVAVVGGQVAEFSGNTSNIVGYRKVPLTNEAIRHFIKWRSPFNHPTVMINKKKLQKVGGYIPFGNLEDYYLWARFIIKENEVYNLPTVLTLMRVDEGLYSRRGNTNNIVFFYKLRKILRQNSIITPSEEIIGDFLMTTNIVLPKNLRKFIYQKFLHSLKGERKN